MTEAERQEALALCHQASKNAALKAMASFGVIPDAPHRCKVSHAEQFNNGLLDFIAQ